jgi:hypothetical protein
MKSETKMRSVFGLCSAVSVLCLAACAFFGPSGCAQSASGWQAQDQASLAAGQTAGTETKSAKCKKDKGGCCKDGKEGSDGKCCKEGKEDSAGCGSKCGGDKEVAAGAEKKCCKAGEKADAQASAEPSAAK